MRPAPPAVPGDAVPGPFGVQVQAVEVGLVTGVVPPGALVGLCALAALVGQVEGAEGHPVVVDKGVADAAWRRKMLLESSQD